MKPKNVAIVHDYLNAYGGAEGVTQAIWELFPNADIFTAIYDADAMKKANAFNDAKIFYPKWKDSIPGQLRQFGHKLLIANLPYYFANLDLSKYDLVISSTAHFAKGVKTNSHQKHVSYIHTPPRFLYGLRGEIRKRNKWYWKPIFWPIDTYLRQMDQEFAKRPDYLICNSETVKKRIRNIYQREAIVINPFPELNVSDEDFKEASLHTGDYYLTLGRLAEYKHVDLIIEACGENGIPLKVAGTGPAYDRLKILADKYACVEMLGFVSPEKKKELYQNCIAGIYAVEDEDFGMAPLEPMLYGKPVIVYKSGGYLETVKDGVNGVFFDELNPQSINEAIQHLRTINFVPHKIREYALGFSKEEFKKKFRAYIEGL